MKLKGINSSSIKTQNLIREEFAKLIYEKKSLDKVSVTELVNNIGITRGAFYSHYNSIDDVAKQFQIEALEIFDENINSISDIDVFLDKINLFLKENFEIYSCILKTNDPMIFMDRLNKIANTKLIELLSQQNNYKNLVLDVSIFVDGIINVYIKFFRNEINITLDEINNYSKEIFKKIFSKYIA